MQVEPDVPVGLLYSAPASHLAENRRLHLREPARKSVIRTLGRSALPCGIGSRHDPDIVAQTSGHRRKDVRTWSQRCSHFITTTSAPCLDRVRTWARPCADLASTMSALCPDPGRNESRVGADVGPTQACFCEDSRVCFARASICGFSFERTFFCMRSMKSTPLR